MSNLDKQLPIVREGIVKSGYHRGMRVRLSWNPAEIDSYEVVFTSDEPGDIRSPERREGSYDQLDSYVWFENGDRVIWQSKPARLHVGKKQPCDLTWPADADDIEKRLREGDWVIEGMFSKYPGVRVPNISPNPQVRVSSPELFLQVEAPKFFLDIQHHLEKCGFPNEIGKHVYGKKECDIEVFGEHFTLENLYGWDSHGCSLRLMKGAERQKYGLPGPLLAAFANLMPTILRFANELIEADQIQREKHETRGKRKR